MIRLVFLLTLFSITQVSCANSNEISYDHIFSRCKIDNIESGNKVIIDNEFISNIVSNDLDWNKVRSKYSSNSVSDFKVKNKHYPEVIDTVHLIESDRNYFSFYSAKDRNFPLCVSVESNQFKFESGVNIGQSISDLKGKFDLDENEKVLIIQDLEGGNTVEVYFDKKRVVKKIIVRADYIG